MNKQNIAISIAALALSTALASVPAFAQNYGRNVNDGGMVTTVPGATSQPSTPQQPSAPSYGRNVNDGGMVAEPTGQRPLYNSVPDSTPPHYGKPLNDGGM